MAFFKLIKQIEGTTSIYGPRAATGGVVELDEPLASRARANPDLEEVDSLPKPKVAKKKASKKTSKKASKKK